MSKNEKTLESFATYCKANPELRFWQALRAWAGVSFILTASGLNMENGKFEGIEDTYYKNGK